MGDFVFSEHRVHIELYFAGMEFPIYTNAVSIELNYLSDLNIDQICSYLIQGSSCLLTQLKH